MLYSHTNSQGNVDTADSFVLQFVLFFVYTWGVIHIVEYKRNRARANLSIWSIRYIIILLVKKIIGAEKTTQRRPSTSWISFTHFILTRTTWNKAIGLSWLVGVLVMSSKPPSCQFRFLLRQRLSIFFMICDT